MLKMAALSAFSAGVGTSCLSVPAHRYLGDIYNRGAKRHGPDRNPIVLIPGILGSRLFDEQTGDPVWGALGGGYLRQHLAHLAFPMERGRDLASLRDGIIPGEVLDRLQVHVGATVEVKAYAQLLAALGVGGYRDETLGRAGIVDYGHDHFTCFQFGYDWRRSSAVNARLLDQFLKEKKSYVEAENRRRFGDSRPVRFDLVAHSMGGLLARYYLRHGASPLPSSGELPRLNWAGAEQVEKAILVGTPSGGSAHAVKQLMNGWRPAPILRAFPPALLATMPSIYELLPQAGVGKISDADGAPVDLFRPEEWVSRRLGLFAAGQDETLISILPEVKSEDKRRKIALDHLEKCLANAHQFHRALDRPAELPSDTRLYLFAGDATETLDSVRIESDGRAREAGFRPGDGTVTRDSALLSRPDYSVSGAVFRSPVDWTHATFIAADHLGLTSDPTFMDNMLHLLLDT